MKVEPDSVLSSLERLLNRSSAEQTELLFVRTTEGLTRFSRNVIHQSLLRTSHQLNIRLVYGKKIGSFLTDRLDREGINYALRQAEEIARHQRNDEYFSSLPSATAKIIDTKSLVEPTVTVSPGDRARVVAKLVESLNKNKIEVNGAFTTKILELAVVNSCGIRSYFITTLAELKVIAERNSLTAYAYRISHNVEDIKIEEIAEELKSKLLIAKKKTEIEPGTYTVVLEPYAVATFIGFLGLVGFGALAFLEGRSFMCTKRGKKIAPQSITIVDDGFNPHTLRQPFDYEGVKKQKVTLIDSGVARNLVYDSRTASMKKRTKNTGHALPAPNTYGPLPLNMIMRPGRRPLESIIKDVEYGIYVTRFHYTNVVEPVSTVLTGMTRDGTFLIKNGKLDHPITDLRFTQSILALLKNIQAVSKEARLCDSPLRTAYVPALCVSDFHFTGKTT
ncbi:TldD/PmbA family protein [Candidatus Sumerlaeota bacterium]|nr:TldD/PmbA family protein [Candidatus Sumerlaeota bacterium]